MGRRLPQCQWRASFERIPVTRNGVIGTCYSSATRAVLVVPAYCVTLQEADGNQLADELNSIR
jgi:hypothetical protein